jgi:predicted amidohydrolase
MKAGLLQLTSGEDPAANLKNVCAMMRDAAGQGAGFILTPEVTNCVSTSRRHQNSVLQHVADDQTLAGLRAQAANLGVWLSIGSLALKTDDPDGRFANRSFVIDPTGDIIAWYDKIHMFDVAVSDTESYCESAGYRPGATAVVAQTAFGGLGLSVCYDVRFAYLYRALAQGGAQIMLVPSAFSPVTGAAHWQPLLQARAIETGSYVLAAAQTGDHGGRTTYGHSMAISPWGEVLLDAGTTNSVGIVDLDLRSVSDARTRIAALSHDRAFEGP